MRTSPPPLPPLPNRTPWSVRPSLSILLSLCLGLFLADAVVSLVDDSLILFFGAHLLGSIRGLLFVSALLMALGIYCLMGLTPMIPKRFFVPLTLFHLVAGLVAVPFLIYFHGRMQQVAWAISFYQVLFGLFILYRVQGDIKLCWPFVSENQLYALRFSWRNLSLFLLVNVFVLLPVVMGYLGLCAARAVDHFSEGFLALRPEGLTVQVRKYVRSDGRTIQLVPMMHIGEPEFYRQLSQSFPTNSLILMEGVTDNRNLLTNRITYQRMATTLGVAEQQQEFKPRGRMVRADLDLEQFATNTIDFLNLVMLIQSKGLNAETVPKLMEYSEPANFQQELFGDLLGKRNRHLWEEIQARLVQTQTIIVPWGAAHMPELAREIQKAGFQVEESREYVAIRFRSGPNKLKSAGKADEAGKSK